MGYHVSEFVSSGLVGEREGTGVVFAHTMGLRPDLQSTAEQDSVFVQKGLGFIEERDRRRRSVPVKI